MGGLNSKLVFIVRPKNIDTNWLEPEMVGQNGRLAEKQISCFLGYWPNHFFWNTQLLFKQRATQFFTNNCLINGVFRIDCTYHRNSLNLSYLYFICYIRPGRQNRDAHVVTVYDIQNKFIAYKAPYPDVVDIVSEWGSLYIVAGDGKVNTILDKKCKILLWNEFRECYKASVWQAL